MFAVLDVVNKKLLILHEGFAPMMFFSSLWTMLFTFPLAWMHWQTPNTTELGWLILLGIGANGLLGCLLKASSCCDLSALQPLRYTEFIFSCVFSILIFHEQPTFQVLCGLAFIVPTTLYLGHHELRLEKNKLQSL
jgi:S-adenosylmethionine uptake transporter